MKSNLVLFAAAVLLAMPVSSVAAGNQTIDPRSVPLAVDPTVLGLSIEGPVVASGRLVDGDDRPARGRVALLAWPNEDVNRSLNSGATFTTPTVGWAKTKADGSFGVRLDIARVSDEYRGRDRMINLLAVGWTNRAEGTYSFGVRLDPANAPSSPREIPKVTLTADQPLSSRDALSTRGIRIAEPFSIDAGVPICGWVVLATHDVMVVVGEGWPYGADRSYMKSVSSHTETLGVAVSSSGMIGSWSQSGTTVASSGVTFTWAESTEFRDYRDQHRYARVRQRCSGQWIGSYYEKEQFPTGGFGNALIYPYPRWTNCAPVPTGLWERSASSGNHYHLSVGVKIGGVIGIDLSSDSNYDASHILYLRLTANGKVCGNDAVPSLASKVESNR
jgi:hypothetical protein